MAYLQIESAVEALNVSVLGLDTSYTRKRNFVWQAKLNGSLVVDETTEVQGGAESASYYMSGLTAGVTYEIQVGVYSESWVQIAGFNGTGTPSSQTYLIGATVTFDPNGGSVSPSSASASASVQQPSGYVSIYFPMPTKAGMMCDYWELRQGSTVFANHCTPGAYNSVYANADWQYYTAVAIWKPIGTQTYIYGTKNGVTQWWPATPYIYDGGWHQAQPNIYDGGWN